MLVDIHAHLTDDVYQTPPCEMVKEFESVGGKILVDCGHDQATSFSALKNATDNVAVFAVLGIHPHKPHEFNAEFVQFLAQSATHPKVIAVGEIGLDYHYQGFDKNSQISAFEQQIILSHKLGLPFVVHSRDASADVLNVLRANKNYVTNGFLMHCYSESKEQAKAYMDMGAYFSFGGVITFKNAKKAEIIKSIPTDLILTETDSPYLTPEPFRGKINHPKNVKYVYDFIANTLQISVPELQNMVFENAKRLFTKL